jgi:hypothetical protein
VNFLVNVLNENPHFTTEQFESRRDGPRRAFVRLLTSPSPAKQEEGKQSNTKFGIKQKTEIAQKCECKNAIDGK